MIKKVVDLLWVIRYVALTIVTPCLCLPGFVVYGLILELKHRTAYRMGRYASLEEAVNTACYECYASADKFSNWLHRMAGV